MNLKCNACGQTDMFEVNFDAYTGLDQSGEIVEHHFYVKETGSVTCYGCGSSDIEGLPEGDALDEFLAQVQQDFKSEL